MVPPGKPWYWTQEGEDRYYEAVRNHKLCDGARMPCDKPCTKRFYAMGRGNWFVCYGCIEEVRTFLNVNGYKLMYELGLNDKDPPDPDPDAPILMASWSAYFRDSIRQKTGEEGCYQYNVVLEGVGANKIAVVKVLREITQLPLHEVMKMIGTLPVVVGKNMFKWDAQELRRKLEDAGARIFLR